MKHDETRSKIVCTIGPASQSKKILTGMIEAGMDVARLNMSHATAAIAKKTFETIRAIDDTVAILFDLQGPKIRIGELVEPIILESGKKLILTTEDILGTEQRVSISHKELPQDVKPGDIIAINDGIIRLLVESIDGEEVTIYGTKGDTVKIDDSYIQTLKNCFLHSRSTITNLGSCESNIDSNDWNISSEMPNKDYTTYENKYGIEMQAKEITVGDSKVCIKETSVRTRRDYIKKDK